MKQQVWGIAGENELAVNDINIAYMEERTPPDQLRCMGHRKTNIVAVFWLCPLSK